MDAVRSVPPSSIPMMAPETKLEKIEPNQELPGGLLPFRDPRGWNETPLWPPEQKTLVFGDALTEGAGVLRVWMSPTHRDRALPDLRVMLGLPFERVIISHGEPCIPARRLSERWNSGVAGRASPPGCLSWRPRPGQESGRSGADLTARDELHNTTLLDWARSGRHQDVINYLESVTTDSS